MMRTTMALALALAAALLGCDEPSGGDGDGDVDGDAGGDADGDAGGDADGDSDSASDGGAETLSCPGALACIRECGAADDCAVACTTRVCEGGRDSLQAVVVCGANHCGEPCADRASVACVDCLQAQCAVQAWSCTTTSCVPGELSCSEASYCMALCRADRPCAEGCAARICPRGATALDAIETCRDGSCASECADYGAGACGDCLLARCRPESNACLGAACQ